MSNRITKAQRRKLSEDQLRLLVETRDELKARLAKLDRMIVRAMKAHIDQFGYDDDEEGS